MSPRGTTNLTDSTTAVLARWRSKAMAMLLECRGQHVTKAYPTTTGKSKNNQDSNTFVWPPLGRFTGLYFQWDSVTEWCRKYWNNIRLSSNYRRRKKENKIIDKQTMFVWVGSRRGYKKMCLSCCHLYISNSHTDKNNTNCVPGNALKTIDCDRFRTTPSYV